MGLKVGDTVTLMSDGTKGIVREVEEEGIEIFWPTAFGWASGHATWYMHEEIQDYGIVKA